MTSPVALMANIAPPTTPSSNAPSNDSSNSSSSSASNDFNTPLQQARQQFAQRGDASPHGKHASKSASSSSQAKTKSTTHDDKPSTTTPDATTAMLALLGQSVPASAAASPVSANADADDGTDAVTATGTSAATALMTSPATVSLLGAIQGAGQAKSGAGDDLASDMDGIKDKSLSMAALGGDDDAADVTTAADAGQSAKGDALSNALQALTTSTSSSQSESKDPLEALKNLAALAAPQQQAQAPLSTATTPTAHVLTMQSSVDSPSFGQELSQQVTWLGGQDVKEARIRLHPEDMGELDVKVSVKQDHVDVAFIAQHPQAVHAVQQTLSQLDSMLAHHGLSLGQTMVGQGNTGNGSSQSGSSGNSANGGEGALAEGVEALASVAAPVSKVVGLVDMFA
jgi:flagellar hook-length control protein FliK